MAETGAAGTATGRVRRVVDFRMGLASTPGVTG